jgi:hypothetical protein
MEDLADVKRKLKEINAIVVDLDPSIRVAAFDFLVPLVFANCPAQKEPGTPARTRPKDDDDKSVGREDFFSKTSHDKPADNVHHIAAWLYSEHGVVEISRQMLSDIADDVGLTIPERPDNTMRSAKNDGKVLYRQKNSGWQLTVHGETYVKTTYDVRKGKKPLPTVGQASNRQVPLHVPF